MIQKISLPVTATILFILAIGVVISYSFFRHQNTNETPTFFGIPLVPPTFAQGGGSTFPDPNAGISAYIQRDPNLIDLTAISPIFDETIQNGENYIIGAFNVSRTELQVPNPQEALVHVRVYVDTDGFIIAYLAKDKVAADIFRWYFSDPPVDPLETVLSDALERVTTTVGAPSPTDASWYHWNYPSATHFSAAVRKGAGNMYMLIPAGAAFSEDPSYLWNSNRQSGSSSTSGTLNLYDLIGTQTVLELPQSNNVFNVQNLPPITPGERYTFEIKNGGGGVAQNHFLGVAAIYEIP